MLSKFTVFGGVFAVLALAAAGCGQQPATQTEEPAAPAPAAEAPETVVDVIASSPDHTTLLAAVQAAGLADTLKGEGPFTVFAPTNAAFEKLPEGLVEDLLKPENKDQLVAVLTYHVVPADVTAADAKALDGQTADTVQGKTIAISLDGETVKVNDAAVVAADLEAGNGVVHAIDTVLIPSE